MDTVFKRIKKKLTDTGFWFWFFGNWTNLVIRTFWFFLLDISFGFSGIGLIDLMINQLLIQMYFAPTGFAIAQLPYFTFMVFTYAIVHNPNYVQGSYQSTTRRITQIKKLLNPEASKFFDIGYYQLFQIGLSFSNDAG